MGVPTCTSYHVGTPQKAEPKNVLSLALIISIESFSNQNTSSYFEYSVHNSVFEINDFLGDAN